MLINREYKFRIRNEKNFSKFIYIIYNCKKIPIIV